MLDGGRVEPDRSDEVRNAVPGGLGVDRRGACEVRLERLAYQLRLRRPPLACAPSQRASELAWETKREKVVLHVVQM